MALLIRLHKYIDCIFPFPVMAAMINFKYPAFGYWEILLCEICVTRLLMGTSQGSQGSNGHLTLLTNCIIFVTLKRFYAK